MVGTADRSELGMQWALVGREASRRVPVDSAEIARQEGFERSSSDPHG
jgi:hypothetical protein